MQLWRTLQLGALSDLSIFGSTNWPKRRDGFWLMRRSRVFHVILHIHMRSKRSSKRLLSFALLHRMWTMTWSKRPLRAKMRLQGHTNCPRCMTVTSNMRTSLPHKASSSMPSHSSSSRHRATKGCRVRNLSLQPEGHAFSSPPGSPNPQSRHHLMYKPLPLLWPSTRPLSFPQLFLHPILPPTHTTRMPLLPSSRHPDLQPQLLLRRRILHTLPPMFLPLQAILTLQCTPFSHRSRTS
jgi:hypothetical protein